MSVRPYGPHYHVIEVFSGRLPSGDPKVFGTLDRAHEYARARIEVIQREYSEAGREAPLVETEGDNSYLVVSVNPPDVERVLRISVCTDSACARRWWSRR
jgi:hypothetical protein